MKKKKTKQSKTKQRNKQHDVLSDRFGLPDHNATGGSHMFLRLLQVNTRPVLKTLFANTLGKISSGSCV